MWDAVLLTKSKDDVLASFGTKLTLEDVFMLGKVRLEVPLLPSEDALLTLQKLESHIGSTEIPADADEVGGLSSTTIDDLLFTSSPRQVMLMQRPVRLAEVSPPTKSTP